MTWLISISTVPVAVSFYPASLTGIFSQTLETTARTAVFGSSSVAMNKSTPFSLVWPDLKRDKFRNKLPARNKLLSASKRIKSSSFQTLAKKNILRELNLWQTLKHSLSRKSRPITAKEYLEKCQQTKCRLNLQLAFAELEAVADFGNSNATVRFVSPIISLEVNRLLKAK